MDLGEWLAAARVRALLQIIDGLPEHSRYRHALVNTPATATEIAEAMLRHPAQEWEPDWTWRSPAVFLLRALHGTYVAAHSEGRDPELLPEPPSLAARLHREMEQATNQAFFDSLTFADA